MTDALPWRRFMRNGVAAVTLMALGACLGAVAGCGTDEAEAFSEIEHYGGRSLVPQDHSFGVCVASFAEDDPAADVIDHYRAALSSSGWTVHDDDGYAIAAQRDGLQVTIGVTPEDAGSRRYEILLGEAPPVVSE